MEKFIVNTISINAPAKAVWDWMTQADKTKQYMFGCETVSDWNAGSSLLWKGQLDGKELIFVKGHIEEISAPNKLVYTVFDPFSTMEDKPENYLSVTYTIEFINGATQLTVIQGDYTKVAEGEKRYKASYNNGEGWNPILVQIKQLVEASN